MTIKDMSVDALKEYENNPRNNESAVDKVAASIKEFGFRVPIVIDRDNVIVAGHTRLKAARQLGLSTVPCIVADDLTPEQVRAYRLADNKAGEAADWDYNKLEAEIFELRHFGLGRFGFETDEINPDDFGDEFELSDSDVPQKRTITMTLSPEQFKIAEAVIEHTKERIEHDFGNENERSNALFEAIYLWAEQNGMV